MKNINILDCTLRDGGYYNEWYFSESFINDYLKFISLSGIEFESSFKLSILTIMNTVNSSMFGLRDFDFYELHFMTKYYLIFFMIIGRLELLTLLIICKKFLFKN